MSFVAIGTLGATALTGSATTAVVAGAALGATASGIKAMGNDNSAGVRAATEMSMAERAQMGTETKHEMNKINAKTQSMLDMATSQGQNNMANVYSSKEKMSRSGFQSDEASSRAVSDSKSAVYGDYRGKVDSIMSDDELNKTSISLGDQRKSANIEKSFASNMASATSQADSFLEGFTGQSNYKVG